MNIVILDGHAINPGDLSWDALKALGALEVFDRTAENLIVQRAQEAEVLLTTRNTSLRPNPAATEASALHRLHIHRL